MADKRKVQKQQHNYASAKERVEKHDSGYSPTAVKLPEGTERLVFDKKGTYRFDVVPYVVGKGNPFADEGALWCERTYYTHRNIGPDNKSYCCLAKTFKKRCPICEEIAHINRSGGDQEMAKALKPSERQLWNVRDLNDEGKIKVLDQSNFLFGSLIDAKVQAADDEDHYETYFHLEGGHTLKVTVDQETFQGRSFYKATNIEMKERKQDLDDDILKETVCLDDCLVELAYDKLKAIFLQQTEDDEDSDDDDTPSQKRSPSKNSKASAASSKRSKDDEEDEDEEDEEEEDDTDGEDEDEDEDEEDDEDEDEDEDDSEDEDEDDDDEDSDDEDEEEEPAPKKKPGRPNKK